MKMNKHFLISLIAMLLLFNINGQAQRFDEYFNDATLRIDYAFTGNAVSQNVSVDKISRIPRWYGKRKRLAEVPVMGNGTITVCSHRTGEVIYKQSFSTLFQEWLTTSEAKTLSKSFENVFLVPMPKDTVDVTVELRNNRLETVASLTHTVAPDDILIRRVGEKFVTPYKTIVQPADTTNCIDIAFVAEGYTESEMNVFIDDVNTAVDAIFGHEPFKSMRNRFRVVAVKSESKESGTSEPSKGVWKKTALSSHFDTFYSDRYLTTLALKDLHDCLAGVPYEHIIVLVNTEKYGGGGILNSYNLSMTHHKKFRPVVAHEFGHSFAGLADEYAYDGDDTDMYPLDVEPWEPNITTLKDFSAKWKDMLGKNTPVPTPATKENISKIGVYEGAGYCPKGVYRPMQSCRMRDNENPNFCPVCQRAIRQMIDFYTE